MRKKLYYLLILFAFCGALLRACEFIQSHFHEHDWQDATCIEPRTCSICDLTDGEPRGHDWKKQPVSCPKPAEYVAQRKAGVPIIFGWMRLALNPSVAVFAEQNAIGIHFLTDMNGRTLLALSQKLVPSAVQQMVNQNIISAIIGIPPLMLLAILRVLRKQHVSIADMSNQKKSQS